MWHGSSENQIVGTSDVQLGLLFFWQCRDLSFEGLVQHLKLR